LPLVEVTRAGRTRQRAGDTALRLAAAFGKRSISAALERELMLLGVRDLLIKQRTAVINTIQAMLRSLV